MHARNVVDTRFDDAVALVNEDTNSKFDDSLIATLLYECADSIDGNGWAAIKPRPGWFGRPTEYRLVVAVESALETLLTQEAEAAYEARGPIWTERADND